MEGVPRYLKKKSHKYWGKSRNLFSNIITQTSLLDYFFFLIIYFFKNLSLKNTQKSKKTRGIFFIFVSFVKP